MEINSVAILGAGAVGSYLIWGLSNLDIKSGIIAEGDRAKRLKENGCKINNTIYRPEVWTPDEAAGVDLLVVCLKYGSLPGALDSIKKVVKENTIVMSLMNGVDSEEIMAGVIDKANILYSFIKIASRGINGGFVFDPDATVGIIYGELTAPFESDRVKAVTSLFHKAGLKARSSELIKEEIWAKYRLNVCFNLPQAILGSGVGCYNDSIHMKTISDGLKDELEAIALAKGIDLNKLDASLTQGSIVKPSARYSTLQDIDAKRHTEIDMFSGTLSRMGKELGIPTPYNDFTYHMIKAIEEKNDGLFDYQ